MDDPEEIVSRELLRGKPEHAGGGGAGEGKLTIRIEEQDGVGAVFDEGAKAFLGLIIAAGGVDDIASLAGKSAAQAENGGFGRGHLRTGMPGRLGQAFETSGPYSRDFIDGAFHRPVEMAVQTGGQNMGVGGNDGFDLGEMEIVGKDVDRVTAEQLKTGSSEKPVPILFEANGGSVRARVP